MAEDDFDWSAWAESLVTQEEPPSEEKPQAKYWYDEGYVAPSTPPEPEAAFSEVTSSVDDSVDGEGKREPADHDDDDDDNERDGDNADDGDHNEEWESQPMFDGRSDSQLDLERPLGGIHMVNPVPPRKWNRQQGRYEELLAIPDIAPDPDPSDKGDHAVVPIQNLEELLAQIDNPNDVSLVPVNTATAEGADGADREAINDVAAGGGHYSTGRIKWSFNSMVCQSMPIEAQFADFSENIGWVGTDANPELHLHHEPFHQKGAIRISDLRRRNQEKAIEELKVERQRQPPALKSSCANQSAGSSSANDPMPVGPAQATPCTQASGAPGEELPKTMTERLPGTRRSPGVPKPKPAQRRPAGADPVVNKRGLSLLPGMPLPVLPQLSSSENEVAKVEGSKEAAEETFVPPWRRCPGESAAMLHFRQLLAQHGQQGQN